MHYTCGNWIQFVFAGSNVWNDRISESIERTQFTGWYINNATDNCKGQLFWLIGKIATKRIYLHL